MSDCGGTTLTWMNIKILKYGHVQKQIFVFQCISILECRLSFGPCNPHRERFCDSWTQARPVDKFQNSARATRHRLFDST